MIDRASTPLHTQQLDSRSVSFGVFRTTEGECSRDRDVKHNSFHGLIMSLSLQDALPGGFASGDVLIPLADEYDPMYPNDYEKVVKRHREEQQRKREQERQKEMEEREKY